ncbi:MAG TPA: MFS transporter [Ktedonobacteraceae bacterium]
MIALRERNFRLYWLGQAVSNIGNWMQVVALGWFILQLTGSPLALGLLGLAQFLPIFLLSLAGGILADRFLRLHLLMVTQSAAMALAFILTILALMGKPPLWSLLLIAALSAAVTAIDNPARQAFLSDLVGKDLLLSAVALNASVYNGAAVIGPSLAGLVLLRVGAAGCFLLNAFSFLAVLVALTVISVEKANQGKVSLTSARGNKSFTTSLREFGSLRHKPAILAVLGIAAATSLLGRPYLLLMPAFAREVQHVGPQGLGLMVAASGLGSLMGALLLASLRSSKRLERLLLITGVCFGISLAIFALVPYFLLASLALIGCGAGATMTMMIANTLLQTSAPSAMKGRVMSLYTLIAAGFTPLGAFIVTGMSTKIGLEDATILASIGVTIVAISGFQFIGRKYS